MEQAGEIVFPTDPKKGDIFITPEGKSFIWDGDSWEVYTLPPEWKDVRNKPDAFPPVIAAKDVVGGIKPGRNVTVDYDGTLNASGGGGSSDWADITNKPDEFPPVVATYARVGGVKPGKNINIEPDGTITAAGGGAGTGSIADFPRLPPAVFAPNFALQAMSQGGEDVAMTAEELFGGIFNSPVNQKIVDQFGNFYQLFPGKDGAAFAVQIFKVNADPAVLNKDGVIVNLHLPLLGDKYLDAWQASATLEPTSVGSVVSGGWSVSISLEKTRDKIKLQAIQTSTIKPIPIRIMVMGFVKQPVYPTPMPLPPVITRAVPMNGGFRLFFKPQEGTLLETVDTWGFLADDGSTTFISEVGYSYRFIQIGIDDEYEPDEVGLFNNSWRKRFGEGLQTGSYVNGKEYTWKPYAVNKQYRISPYGQSVKIAPTDKAPLHSPNVLRWEKEDRTYTVHFTLPEGVKFEDVKTVTYYALFYDDTKPKPYLNEVGVGVTGQAKFRKDGDEIVATFPEPYKKDGWKSYFWLSFENAAGSSPESIYLFDPPLYPIVYGPTITQIEASTQGIYLAWENKDPNEEVFWTRCTVAYSDLPVREETLYGNPGKWDYKFDPPLQKGEYTVKVEQFGYNYYNHASDSREIAIYDPGELPPPYVDRVLPTYGGVKAHYRPSKFADPSQYEGYYAEIKDLKTGQTVGYNNETWERAFNIDGIDDGGIPFYMTLLGKGVQDNVVQLDADGEYTIAFAGVADDQKGVFTTPKYFRTSKKAPQGRIVPSYYKFDEAKGLLDLELFVPMLNEDVVTAIYATVFSYTGTAADPDELFTQQVTPLNFNEDGESFWAKLSLDQWQEGRKWLIVFDFTNQNGTSAWSWPISNDDTVDPVPEPPEKPVIKSVTLTAVSMTVEWESTSADPDKQDWYGYGLVIKDANNNTVYTDRTSSNGEAFVWKTATPIPGGTYLVYVDALGFDYNASTVKPVVVPGDTGPKPPKFDYVMSPQPWQLAAAWTSDEPRIEKFVLYYGVEGGTEYAITFGPDDRKWLSPDPDKNPPGIFPAVYNVSIEVWRDGLSSGRSATVPVTVKNYDLTPPKLTRFTQQPGYKVLIEWDVMATADYVEIVVQAGKPISQRVKMPAGSTVFQLEYPGNYTVIARNDYKRQLGPWSAPFTIYLKPE